MPSPRWLAILTVSMMAGTALITGTAVAVADPADDAYLAQLHALGFTWPPAVDPDMISMAHNICNDLGWGWKPDQIAQSVHSTLDPDGVAFGQVTSMVSLAHSTYCPNQRCWAPHCWF